MLWNVYWLHDLISFIVLNKDFQFISIMWQSLCKRLRITANLFTVYHLKTNDQLKQVNQDVERELRIYCNYMQNDWVKWLSMMKFNENFNISSVISMISFYFNKSFHFQMNFNSNMTDYEIIHERLEARKVDDIIVKMKEFFIFNNH
jgi:hypothetical protein